MSTVNYPFDSNEVLRNKKALKRELSEQSDLIEKRIAILSGDAVGDIPEVLEVFLLSFGIKMKSFTGQYNRFYEDIIFGNGELSDFNPEIIIIHTSQHNLTDNEIIIKLEAVWEKIKLDYSCTIIQNNFEIPIYSSENERDEVNRLNIKFTEYKKRNQDFYINDIQYLSAYHGLEKWSDSKDYYMYKYPLSVKSIPQYCFNIAKIIKSNYGKNQKCLVLDLDDTIWGGIAGDVGSSGIELGEDSALGQAYISFQKYVKKLHRKGIILAVCTKNEEIAAKEAFTNPDMVLQLSDFSAFYASWDNKAEGILKVSEQLNILPESIVFVDDNPAERELVRHILPMVKIVEADSVIDFIGYIENAGYFYNANVSDNDLKRNEYYQSNILRSELKKTYINYGEFLQSLQMSCEIKAFDSGHLDRITQLINKTNQFNLTSKRYSRNEIKVLSESIEIITLYATLDDKFGSNGIVSALIGEITGDSLHLQLWVMSCRVFKRDLELAVYDKLVEICKSRDIKKITGYYYKTERNSFVCNLFEELGFEKIDNNTWVFDLIPEYTNKNKYINIAKGNS